MSFRAVLLALAAIVFLVPMEGCYQKHEVQREDCVDLPEAGICPSQAEITTTFKEKYRDPGGVGNCTDRFVSLDRGPVLVSPREGTVTGGAGAAGSGGASANARCCYLLTTVYDYFYCG